jgi:sulfite oxidase
LPWKPESSAHKLRRYYHYAMGPTLSELPDISWKYVLKEKSEDMIHVLQFPYNGEPPRVSKHL